MMNSTIIIADSPESVIMFFLNAAVFANAVVN